MLKRSANEKRWRALQESHSSAHRRQQRRVLIVRCLLVSALLLFTLVAVLLVRKMNAYYEANVIINYHRTPKSRDLQQNHDGTDSNALDNQVVSGISLDSIGDLVLNDPEHKLCDTKLFFIETASDLAQLTPVLQGGSTLEYTSGISMDECCSKCSSSLCDGFRWKNSQCSLLAFPHIDVQVDDDVVQQPKPHDEDEDDEFEDGKREEIVQQRDHKTSNIRHGLNEPTADLDVDLVQDASEGGEEKEDEGLNWEDVNAAEEQTNAKTDGEEKEDKQEDLPELDLDFSLDVEEGEGEGEGEPAREHEDAENGEEDMHQSDEEEDLNNLVSMFEPDSDKNGAESEENVLSPVMPEELQAIDHSGEAEELRDFLGVSDDNSFLSNENEQELMDKLMNQLNGRHKKGEEEDDEESKKPKKPSTEEDQNDAEVNLELGKAKLGTYIPLGDYQRLTARDAFYGKHKTLVLRYRTNREIVSVAQEMPSFFDDVEFTSYGKSGDKKKPQLLRTLRVGNGRRGKHVFVVATLRGCEWTSALATLHTALVLKGRGSTTKSLLDAVQFHFIPIANPDGFDYSHHKSPSNARSWCKNRRVAVSGYHGVDLEHNWGLDGVSWGFGKRDAAGARLDTFQGPSNFSEPETRALRDYMQHYATGRGRVALLYVRCCAGTIIAPQVYRNDIPNPINVNQMANLMVKHVERTDGSRYTVTPRETTFHEKNHGQMIDWAHNEAMIDHAYTIEVKGLGLSTRADHAKISVEPFQTLLRELETATVFVATRLLQQPIEGPAVNSPYKSSAAISSSDTSSSSSSSSSSSHSKKGSSDSHKKKKKKT